MYQISWNRNYLRKQKFYQLKIWSAKIKKVKALHSNEKLKWRVNRDYYGTTGRHCCSVDRSQVFWQLCTHCVHTVCACCVHGVCVYFQPGTSPLRGPRYVWPHGGLHILEWSDVGLFRGSVYRGLYVHPDVVLCLADLLGDGLYPAQLPIGTLRLSCVLWPGSVRDSEWRGGVCHHWDRWDSYM